MNIYNAVCQTQQNFMFIIVLGHVSILTESSSGPSKETYLLKMFKNVAWDSPKAYILDKTMYKMHVILLLLYNWDTYL